MASYLKNTYVDGSLSVEGAIKVRSLETSDGAVPLLDDDKVRKQNFLVKFSNSTATKLANAPFEIYSNEYAQISHQEDYANSLIKANSGDSSHGRYGSVDLYIGNVPASGTADLAEPLTISSADNKSHIGYHAAVLSATYEDRSLSIKGENNELGFGANVLELAIEGNRVMTFYKPYPGRNGETLTPENDTDPGSAATTIYSEAKSTVVTDSALYLWNDITKTIDGTAQGALTADFRWHYKQQPGSTPVVTP